MIRSLAAPAEGFEFDEGDVLASKEKLNEVVVTAIPPISFGDLSFSRQFVQILKETRPASKVKWVLVAADNRLPYIQEHRKEIEIDGVELVLESYSKFSPLTKYHGEFLKANVWCGPGPNLFPMAALRQLNNFYGAKFFIHYDTLNEPFITKAFTEADVPLASVYTTGVTGHGVFFDPMLDRLTTSTDFSDVQALKAIGIDSSADLDTYRKEHVLFHGYWARNSHLLSPMNLFSQPLFIAVCIQIMLLQGARKNVDILVPYPLSIEEQDELAVFLKAIFPNNINEYSLIYSENESAKVKREDKYSPTKRTIRIHAYGDVSKRDMLMMQKVSEPFTAATGDQSVIECLDKLLIYQTMQWKRPMMEYLLSATEAEGLELLHQWFQLTSRENSSETRNSEELVFQIAEFYTMHVRELLKEVNQFYTMLRATKNLNKTMPEWILNEVKPPPPPPPISPARSLSISLLQDDSPFWVVGSPISPMQNRSSFDVTKFDADDNFSSQLGDEILANRVHFPSVPINKQTEDSENIIELLLGIDDVFDPLLTPIELPINHIIDIAPPMVGVENTSLNKLASIPFFKPREVATSKEQQLFFKKVNTKLLDLKIITQKIGLLESPDRRDAAMVSLSKLEQDVVIQNLYTILSDPSHVTHKVLTDYLLGKGFSLKMLNLLVQQATNYGSAMKLSC